MNVHSVVDLSITMDKKERIFEAAHEILGERGFYGLSIAVVAKKAKGGGRHHLSLFQRQDDLIASSIFYYPQSVSSLVMEGVQMKKVSYKAVSTPLAQHRCHLHQLPNALSANCSTEVLHLGAGWSGIGHQWRRGRHDTFFEQGRQQGLFIDLPILVLQA